MQPTIFFLFLATLVVLSSAFSAISGTLVISDTLRARDIVVKGSRSDDSDQDSNKSDEEDKNNLTEGITTQNIWCAQCSFGNLEAKDKTVSQSINVNIIRGAVNSTSSEEQGVINIAGEMKQAEGLDSGTLTIGLLETASITSQGVKQWALLESEAFSFSESQSNSTRLQNDWKVIKLDSGKETAMQGNPMEIAQGTLNEKIVKEFVDLPEHSHLKIEGNFYFISPFWRGESAQIRIDARIAWLDSHEWTNEAFKQANMEDICAMNPSDFNEFIWISPLSVVVPHSSSSFLIELGLTKAISSILQCKQLSQKLSDIPLFGFDDLSIYIK